MDTAKIEQGIRLILEGVGENPEREGLRDTPARVARMYEEVFAGLTQDPSEHFVTTFDEHHEEMVLVRDIPFYSMCEHHLAPFYGTANIAYIPAADGRICGLSKLARLVEVFARRDVAQREGLAHHVGAAGAQRVHVLQKLVAQATLEEGGAECGGADFGQQGAGGGVQCHGFRVQCKKGGG